MDFSGADQRDMSGFTRAEVFLKKDALGIVNLLQPGARVLGRLAKYRMDRAGRRTQRVLDDERLGMSFEQLFGFQTVPGNMRLRKWDAVFLAKFSSKITFPFDPHGFARR